MKILSLLVVSFALVACFPKSPEMPAPSSSLDKMLEEKMAAEKAEMTDDAEEAEAEVEAPVTEAPTENEAVVVEETEEQKMEREEAEAAQIKAEEDPSIVIEEELTDQPIIIE